MKRNITLAALLDVLWREDAVIIVKRMGMNLLEAVASGPAAELRKSGRVSTCGKCTVKRVTVEPGEWPNLVWPGLSRPVLLVTIS